MNYLPPILDCITLGTVLFKSRGSSTNIIFYFELKRRFEETIASPSTDETRSTSFDSTGPALIDRHITVLIDIDISE